MNIDLKAYNDPGNSRVGGGLVNGGGSIVVN
jgi:hypothetical protein